MSREMVGASGGLSDKSALNRVKNTMLSANFVSNAIGVGVVFFLSRGAPAEVESISRNVSWVFVPMAFLVPWIVTRFYERPVRGYWDAIYRKELISKEKMDRSHRRLLNEPYFVIAVDMGVWLTAAGVYALVFWLFKVDWPFVRQAFTLCVITGLITSTVAFFVLEFHL